MDEQHHPDQERDEDHDEVRAVPELLVDDDREDDGGEDRARGVDDRAPAPARAAFAEPVLDHADLAEREAHEHADGVERD